jgi:hypothetical protein
MKSNKSSHLAAVTLVGALLSTLAWPETAHALPRRKVMADTGVLALGPDQVLRLTLTSTATKDIPFRFRRMQYDVPGCDQGVCGYELASSSLTDAQILGPGQAISIELRGGSAGGRIMALTLENALISSFSLRANGEIRDANTNGIIAILIGLLAPSRPRGSAIPLFDLADPID